MFRGEFTPVNDKFKKKVINLNFYLLKLEKKEKTKCEASRRKRIIRGKMEIIKTD